MRSTIIAGVRAVLWGSVAALAALAALVATGATRAADAATTGALQRLANPALDLAADLDTVVGYSAVAVAIAAVAAAVLLARGQRDAALVPLAILVTGAVELALKLALDHPAPPRELSRATLLRGTGFDTPSSFPSGHAARVVFLCALAAWSSASAAVRAAAVALAAFTLFARVYIGDHWLSDVLGGAALGLGTAAAALLWYERPRRAPR